MFGGWKLWRVHGVCGGDGSCIEPMKCAGGWML